jgi:hypothetical protein
MRNGGGKREREKSGRRESESVKKKMKMEKEKKNNKIPIKFKTYRIVTRLSCGGTSRSRAEQNRLLLREYSLSLGARKIKNQKFRIRPEKGKKKNKSEFKS